MRLSSRSNNFWVLSQNCEIRLQASSCPSVCRSARNSSAPTVQILIKFHIWGFFENLSRKFGFNVKSVDNNGYLKWRLICIILIISRSGLLTIRDISNKSFRGNHNRHIAFSNFFFRKSLRLWEYVEKYCREGQDIDDIMAYTHCMLDT